MYLYVCTLWVKVHGRISDVHFYQNHYASNGIITMIMDSHLFLGLPKTSLMLQIHTYVIQYKLDNQDLLGVLTYIYTIYSCLSIVSMCMSIVWNCAHRSTIKHIELRLNDKVKLLKDLGSPDTMQVIFSWMKLINWFIPKQRWIGDKQHCVE
jgi:hypothetical protein